MKACPLSLKSNAVIMLPYPYWRGLNILLFFVFTNMNVDFYFYRLFIIPSWNVYA